MPDKLVAVIWDDATVDAETSYTREEIQSRTLPRYTTFGVLLRDDAQLVCVAAERCDDNTYRGASNIPRGMVRDVVPIGRWPKPRRRRLQSVEASDGDHERRAVRVLE